MRIRNLILVVFLISVAVPALAWTHGRRVRVKSTPSRPQFDLVVEGGIAEPLGDLADDFVGTQKGMGAATGWEVGGRLRYYLSPTTSVGPAVHYTDFGDWDDFDVDTPYSVRTQILRVGVDIQQFLAPRGDPVRPYITLGVSLCHNTYEDWMETAGTYTTSSNNLGLSAGGGLAMGPFELSALWTYNPVQDRNLPLGQGALDDEFDWNYLVVRAGIAFGG